MMRHIMSQQMSWCLDSYQSYHDGSWYLTSVYRSRLKTNFSHDNCHDTCCDIYHDVYHDIYHDTRGDTQSSCHISWYMLWHTVIMTYFMTYVVIYHVHHDIYHGTYCAIYHDVYHNINLDIYQDINHDIYRIICHDMFVRLCTCVLVYLTSVAVITWYERYSRPLWTCVPSSPGTQYRRGLACYCYSLNCKWVVCFCFLSCVDRSSLRITAARFHTPQNFCRWPSSHIEKTADVKRSRVFTLLSQKHH